ncbi:MAG: radical SAM protein [Acidobacteria bacterium]|nr:MAG: radical SAM protein [Acidobacteriota bacterium]
MRPSILLVLPIREGHNFVVSPDLGLLYLGTALKNKGFEVAVLDCPKENFTFRDFKRFLEERKFDVVGFRCFSRDHNYVHHHARIAKQVNPNVITLAGGPHPSELPGFVLTSMPALDFAWQSEAEEGMPTFLDYVGEYGKEVPGTLLADIPGLVWRDQTQGRVVANPPAFGSDLESFGLPAWELLRPETYPAFVWGGQYYQIVTTRGCPYPCTYCNTPGLSGKKLRHRSIENVLQELRLLKERYRIKSFSIMDDEFTLDRKYAHRLCQAMLDSGLGLTFDCPVGVRLDSLTPELIKVMEAAGCQAIAVGIESGNDRIQGLIKKKVTVDTIREKARMVADSSRIAMVGYFMIGFEDETEEEIWDTINLALELPLTRANFNIVIPIPGTAIFKDCMQKGQIQLETINWDNLTSDQVAFKRNHLSDERLYELQKQAYLRFYRRPHIVWDVTRQTLGNRAVIHASIKKLRMLFRRRTREQFTPLYLREAIV